MTQHQERTPIDFPQCLRARANYPFWLRALVPIGLSPWAVAAGYLALTAWLLVPAPIVLAVAFIAYHDLEKRPWLHGMGRIAFALIMGTTFTALLLVIVALRW